MKIATHRRWWFAALLGLLSVFAFAVDFRIASFLMAGSALFIGWLRPGKIIASTLVFLLGILVGGFATFWNWSDTYHMLILIAKLLKYAIGLLIPGLLAGIAARKIFAKREA